MADNGNVERQDAGVTIGWLAQAEVNTLNTAMWRGVDDAARAHGANLLFVPGDILNSPMGYLAQSNVLYGLLGSENVDGLLVWGGLLSQYISPAEFKLFCEQYEPRPLVNVGMPLEGVASVWVDNYAGMQDAVRHLVSVHGFQRIAFLRGASGPESEDRYRAYTDVLAEHGVALDLELVTPPSNQQRADGEEAIRVLLDERNTEFEAVVASTDAMALGALEELKRRGYRVPGDVAVVGFDDVDEAVMSSPPLTTVRQPVHKLAHEGAELLFSLLSGEGNAGETLQVTLPANLVVRESCGCLDAAVLQVADLVPLKAVEAPLSGGDGDVPAGTFSERFDARRGEILVAMERAAGVDFGAFGPGWAQRLLDSFVLDLGDQAGGIFVSDLGEVLQRVAAGEGDVAAWQGVISAMRQHTLPLLDDSIRDLLRCETLWEQGRVAIAAAAERARAARAFAIQRRTGLLQEVGQTLLSAEHMEELLDAVARELPVLGILGCYLSLYERPESPGAGARLILALDEGRRVELAEGGLSFPSRDLAPVGLLGREAWTSMSLEPLYYRDRQFGYALLEVGPQQAEVREQLRLDLSSALQKGLLVGQLEDRARQLQTAAEVSRTVTGILEPGELMQQMVDLIRGRFELYYVGLFLVDEARAGHEAGAANGDLLQGDGGEPGADGWAVLQVGTGEAGHQMVARGHRLVVGGDSMIGRCVAEGQARIALDVGEEAVHFDNPLLPETRSEMALPLVSRGEVLGALTVQSAQVAAFSDEDVTILQSMADQLSNALANARLYAQAQQAARRSQALYETSSALSTQMEEEPLLQTILEAIYQTLDCEFVNVSTVDEEARTIGLRHIYYRGELDRFPEWMEKSAYPLDHPDITADIYRTGRTEIIGDWDERFNLEIWEEQNHERFLRIFTPIRLRDQVLGVIEVAYEKDQKASVTQDEVALLTAFVDQMAAALQQARLFESTQMALEELEATQRRYMRLAWTDYTLSEEGTGGYVHAGEELGPTAEVWLPQMTKAAQQQTLVAEEDGEHGSALAIPLTVHGEVIGVLGGSRPDGGTWSEEQMTAAQDIVEQMALALENQRLFDEQTRSRRLLDQRVKELDCLSDIGRRIDDLPEVSEFLEWVTKRVPAAMQYPDLCLVAVGYQGQVYGAAEAVDLPCQIVQGVLVGGEQVGRVCIAYREQRDFLDEESALLGDISRRVGGYIENRTLLQQERTRAEEQATLRTITEAVSRSLEMQELLDTAIGVLLPALRFDSLLVSLADEETGRLYLAAEQGLPEAMAHTLEQDGLEGTLCDHVFQTGETIGIGDVRQGAPVNVEGVIKQGLLSYAGIPLSYLGERLGTICGFNQSVREFTAAELTLLESIGDQIGVGVANARLFAETQAALAEVEETHRSYLRQAWQEHLHQRATYRHSGFFYDEARAEQPEDVQMVPDLWLPEMERALEAGTIATSSAADVDGQRAGLALPITIRGETIGILGIEMPEGDHEWTEEEQSFIQSIGEQLGQALEGARLFADTQRRAERERLIGEITAKIRASTDIRDILQTTAVELGQALGTSRASVRIGGIESLGAAIPADEIDQAATLPASQPVSDDS